MDELYQSERRRLNKQLIDLAAASGYVRGPRAAASMMRSLAWYAICPACRDNDHWNHKRPDLEGRFLKPDTPEPGGCWTQANGRILCACKERA